MEEYIDPYCPFCRTEHTVTLYAERTSVYDTLYRCGLCYKVFDQQERLQREAENRKRRPKEDGKLIPVEKPMKKNYRVVYGSILFLCGLLFYFFLC